MAPSRALSIVATARRRLLASRANIAVTRPSLLVPAPAPAPASHRTRTFTGTARRGALQAPTTLDESEGKIFHKLDAALEPESLTVQDVSGGCGSMYALDICSPKFAGLSVIKQHKLVNQILADDIKGWHGVQLKTKAP